MKIPENHWLLKLKSEILQIVPGSRLILYGSRARGEARPDSDWDLLLLTEQERISTELEDALRTPVYLAELARGEPFSLQIFSKKDWKNKFHITPYYENVEKEGIVL